MEDVAVGSASRSYVQYVRKHPNRPNKVGRSKHTSCSLCKPHKTGGAPKFKSKERAKRLDYPIDG